jgi:hypothetical protein
VSRFARSYGASPVHLLAHLVLLPLAAWALLQIFAVNGTGRILLWLAGAVVAHDLILLPLYSVLDRVAERTLAGRRRPALNFVRVPAGLSLLLALVYFPQLSGRGDAAYRRVAGRGFDSPVERWLLACAVMFALSGLLLLVLRGRSATRPAGRAAAAPRRPAP